MKRHVYDKMIAWKNRQGRKPLLMDSSTATRRT